MSSYIKFFIISSDKLFKSFLANELSNKNGIINTTCLNYLNIPFSTTNKFNNIVLVDCENQNISIPFYNKITRDLNLKSIFFIKNSSFDIKEIKNSEFILKSNSFSGYLKTELEKKINSFLNIAQIPYISNIKKTNNNTFLASNKIIVIASSTGGTEALPIILNQLPVNCPPVLIVQHITYGFSERFAKRLDLTSKLTVKEAKNGDEICNGVVYIAPGDFHMEIEKIGFSHHIKITSSNKLHGVRPSADILLNSMNIINAKNIIGIILTGMGLDGANGMLNLHNNGATIIAQDKATCVVYGMPKVAFEIGATDFVLPLSNIAKKVIELL